MRAIFDDFSVIIREKKERWKFKVKECKEWLIYLEKIINKRTAMELNKEDYYITKFRSKNQVSVVYT